MDPQNPWVPFHTFQKSVGSVEPTEPTLTMPLVLQINQKEIYTMEGIQIFTCKFGEWFCSLFRNIYLSLSAILFKVWTVITFTSMQVRRDLVKATNSCFRILCVKKFFMLQILNNAYKKFVKKIKVSVTFEL